MGQPTFIMRGAIYVNNAWEKHKIDGPIYVFNTLDNIRIKYVNKISYTIRDTKHA